MVDVLHRVGIKTSADEVCLALTTVEGLSGWLTNDTRGDGKVGGVLRFRFGAGGFDMKVIELVSKERVRWEVIAGPEEWIGTRVNWEEDRPLGRLPPALVLEENDGVIAFALELLKSLLETGNGAPNPDDTKIDN